MKVQSTVNGRNSQTETDRLRRTDKLETHLSLLSSRPEVGLKTVHQSPRYQFKTLQDSHSNNQSNKCLCAFVPNESALNMTMQICVNIRCETLRFFLFGDEKHQADLQSRRSPVIQREPRLIQRLFRKPHAHLIRVRSRSAHGQLNFLFTGGRRQRRSNRLCQ